MLARWTLGSVWWCRLFNVDGSLSPVDRRTGRYCNKSTRLRFMTPLGLDEARRQHRIHECTIAMRTNLVLEALTSRSRTALRYRFPASESGVLLHRDFIIVVAKNIFSHLSYT
jgi:hypothetical protein